MSTSAPSDSNATWFQPSALPERSLGKSGQPYTIDTSFNRLWYAFMSARAWFALVLLTIHVAIYTWIGNASQWPLALCGAYAALALLVRWLARPQGRGKTFDSQWIYTSGIDLMVFTVLHVTQPSTINYTPLFVLPVLVTSVLGSRALGIGTAALVSIVLVGSAILDSNRTVGGNASDLVQASLTSTGLLLIAWLINLLTSRLAREETRAQQNRAEAQIQSVVNTLVIENLSDGVLVVDMDYKIRAANPAARMMLGSDAEVTPHSFSLEDDEAWRPLIDVAQQSFLEGPVSSIEINLNTSAHAPSRLQVRTQRTPALGQLTRPLCVMFLQDLRVLEARLRTEKLAAMGRLSAAVAHEIRNPLAAIAQANALLEEEMVQATHQKLTAMVRQNVLRLDHIVHDVLDVARVQESETREITNPIALDDTVNAICQDWAEQVKAGPRLLLLPEAPTVQVRFQVEHLRRILVNLLDNALRYASQTPSAIQVITQSLDHSLASLIVWSDGAPLEPSVRRHLFEPFFSSESRSSGLGLFICRELCQRHGAEIGYDRIKRPQLEGSVEGNAFVVHFHQNPVPSRTVVAHSWEGA